MKTDFRSLLLTFFSILIIHLLPSHAHADPTNCVPAPSGLVGWWPGNGNANDAAGTNNGVLVGGTTFAAGEVAQAFSLNGINNAVTNPVPGFTNILNSYTMEFWARPTAGRASTPESTDSTDGDTGQRYAIFPANGRFGNVGSGVSVGTNGVSVVELGNSYMPALLVYDTPITNWTHVAVVYSNQQPSLYLNGVLVRTGLVSVRSSYPSTCFGDNGLGFGFYAGLLDEVAIFNRPLTGAEILSIYDAGSFGKCPLPVPPFFLSQPTNLTVNIGSTATFTALAGGTPPLSFQWMFSGTNIAGATTNTLMLPNVQTNQGGLYAVRVTNGYGTNTSSNALLTILSIPCAPPPANLVSWWRGEDNALDQISTNHGSLQGNTVFASGKVGTAFVFDGSADFVLLGDPPNLRLQDFTIELWVRRTDSGIVSHGSFGNGVLFGYGEGGYGLYLDPSGTPALSQIGGSETKPSIAIVDTAFHHLAVTKSGGTVVFYVDGTAYSAPNYNPTFSFGTPAAIGARADNQDNSFLGVLDEVSVYSRVLSAGEIQGIYNAGSYGKCTAPQSPSILTNPASQTVFAGSDVFFSVVASGSPVLSYQWQFNGTNIAGATGTSLTLTNAQPGQAGAYAVQVSNFIGSTNSSNAILTVVAPPSCVTAPSNLVSWWRAETNAWDQVGGNNGSLSNNVVFADGIVGQGFGFNGTGSVVRIGNATNLQLQNFTIETWVRRASASVVSLNGNGTGYLFSFDNGGYGLSLDSGGHPMLSRVGVSSTTSTGSINDTVPHHIVVTKSGSTVIFYIDGIAYGAASYNPGFSFSGSFWVGGLGANFTFYGIIDELSVYNRALAATEIQDIFAASISGKCPLPFQPFIILQPTNQTVLVGSNVSFVATSGGTPPLAYQWKFKGTNIAGATSNVLVLPNIQSSQAGNYLLAITNVGGFAVSTNALLTVNFPPATFRIVTTNTPSGGAITVPVTIVANGNENAVAFSLNFEPAKLAYTGVTLGSGVPGAFLITNTSLINSGKLGVSVALPPGATLNPGTQQVARISFIAATLPTNSTATNTFGDQPTPRQLLDTQISVLPASYSNGTVSVSAAVSYEGDAFPRPGGDTNTTLADWLLLGRYAARLDYPTNGTEFQRADCAPRATLGDGAIKVTDWVQAGRYAAGFETLTPAGGPTNEQVTAGPSPSASRMLTSSSATVMQGQATSIAITLTAQGNENALGFSLSFDPSLVNYTGAALGGGASGAILYVNSSQAAAGRLGFALALSTGASYSAGTKELIQVSFLAAPTGSGGFLAAFGDLPVPREVSDVTANALPVSFVNGSVTVGPPPSLSIQRAGTNVALSWPIWANNFSLQEAADTLPPGATWSNLPVTPMMVSNVWTVTLPLQAAPRYYRLRGQ